ncbi:MAG: hypothetical protein WBE22_07150 [Halobacteriota archaeon]
MDARDVCIQKYSTALSELENRMELVTGKLKKEQARKEKIVNELENIDLEAKFFQLNTTATTFSVAIKEAVANANSELTRQISHDGKPMKVNRCKEGPLQASWDDNGGFFDKDRGACAYQEQTTPKEN